MPLKKINLFNENNFCKIDYFCQDRLRIDKMKRLGEIFRQEREQHNLLLRQAAAKLDIDQAVLSKIERCERNATKDQLINFSTLYNLDLKKITITWNSEKVSDLLDGETDKKEILQMLIKELK